MKSARVSLELRWAVYYLAMKGEPTIRIALKDLLEEKGMTQYRLRKMIGMTDKGVWDIFHGRTTRIDLSTILKICMALECGVEELIVIEYKPIEKDYSEEFYGS